MDKTAVSTKPLANVAAPPPAERTEELPVVKAAPRKPLTPGRLLYKAMMGVASLRLTVWLFGLSIPLIFLGSLAQVDAGLWSVVRNYFRSALVWVPFSIFSADWPGGFPYPGGWLLGTLLLVNLLAAHTLRFRYTMRRPGIILIHGGVIVIMVSELITGLIAVESHMTIEQDKSTNYAEQTGVAELAVVKKLDKEPGKDDSPPAEMTVIAEPLLKSKEPIRHDMLPFDILVDQYMANSVLLDSRGRGKQNLATAGQGLRFVAQEKREGSGVDPEQKIDVPSAYITLKRKDNQEVLGTFLVSNWLSLSGRLQKVTVDGQTYEIALRPKRTYKDYSIHLVKFTHEVWPNTKTPKHFESRVRIDDPGREEKREVVISMNRPTTYQWETYYQSSFLPGDSGTVLQVVYNPGWPLPYAGFFMVMAGMLFHFGTSLLHFAQRRLV